MSRPVVWKFVLESPLPSSTAIREIQMPVGAEVIHVAEQMGEVCVWARVDEDAASESRVFAVVGTGAPIPEDGAYLGSAHVMSRSFNLVLVWHVFEPACVSVSLPTA